jgi:pimeloyl-ACP methyl ester carboxylesterase/mannose-6-phosphate isomerase-like protein (cupin superfamily)
MNGESRGSYASVNGLEMYYEIHGTGRPLVVLHGAYMTIETMREIVPSLAETRQVIAVELQGHGHTADIDRPLTYEHMADDIAALLRHLVIEEADVFGYSMGGGVALQVAIRHPEVVRKLVVASASYTSDGMYPEVLATIETITPEAFAGSPLEEAYLRTAPSPEAFPNLVAKLKQLDMEPYAWPPEDIRGIEAPTLIVIGDSDAIRPEHAVELFRLLGGSVMGDLSGLPKSQLAVLPGTTHFVPPGFGLLDRADWLVSMIDEFLDAPMPETEQAAGGVTRVVDMANPARGEDANEFQGFRHGVDISFIVVEAPPGGGPRLHRHPYEEVFVVQEGTATFTAGDEIIEAHGGQVVVVPADVLHKFVNTGAGRLRQIDIHASERFVTEWLED